LFGFVWAWVAEVAQFYVAPVVLFPLMLGVLTGLSIVGLIRFAQIGHPPTVLLATVLAAAVAAAGQHGLRYLNTYYGSETSATVKSMSDEALLLLRQEMRPGFCQYMKAQAAQGRPLIGGYTARGFAAWISWTMDAVLVILGAIAVVAPALRVPYCNRCGTWYRTVRGGKIDLPTALRLADLIGADDIGQVRSPRYRLLACHGGCGPTRCDLSWEESCGTTDTVQAWLDPAGRNQAAIILDQPAKEEGPHV
jgi:hypothetical protein